MIYLIIFIILNLKNIFYFNNIILARIKIDWILNLKILFKL